MKIDLGPWRRVLPPPEPPLPLLPEDVTDGPADTGGPDPVVFGSVPRVAPSAFQRQGGK